MRAVLQRVSSASVEVGGREIARIGRGLLVLLGIEKGDTREQADWMARKCVELRIFPDDEGLMNRSIQEIYGDMLVVSQFTLCADIKKGRRPSWINAAQPDEAEVMIDYFIEQLRQLGIKVESGEFGAMMQVGLVNDGPVTIELKR